ncbi:MAG: division/cell wall cluster transcriptional repressor MraZ [Candidatus Hodarchaeales archaeon]|jgi:MraZ protein
MIVGQYKSKLTDKDRISVPVRFRQEIGDGLVVARWYEKCLVLVSKENWDDIKKRLGGKKELITSPIRDIDRFILGSAFEVSLDKQGRFILPEILIDFAEIKEEVVFVGLEDRIEIWSQENWGSLESDVEERASRAIENIAREGK